MNALSLSFLLPLFPLIAACFIYFGSRENRQLSAGLSIGAVSIALLQSAIIFFAFPEVSEVPFGLSFHWLEVSSFHLDLGLLVDGTTVMMLLVVTAVSLLVQIFTAGYMKEDPAFSEFYALLSLFTAAMLGLVLSDNLFCLYIFWELVGLCSFLLIGFWSYKPAAGDASLKAFLVNRVGDCGLLVGILLLLQYSSGLWGGVFLGFQDLPAIVTQLKANPDVPLLAICVFLLLGPMAKSAQFPLHTWLPDAMEGPTPISALIHAATMVAAGVYLLARLYPLFSASPEAMLLVASVGLVTAVFAASIALTQYDIKKVLAYSTCSQLGYMVMCVGLGSWTGALFHLFTHAFFKALLFLGSGSVIHGCHHEQDIRQYGGLAKYMPITHFTFLLGTLAIAGVPGLAGFWSKEPIIAQAYQFNALFYWASSLTAGLTAFYMFRVYFLTFVGSYRGHEHPHESPLSMTVPLCLLAVPTVLAGFLGTHLSLFGGNLFAHYLDPSHGAGHSLSLGAFFGEFAHWESFLPIIFSLFGIVLAKLIYADKLISWNDPLKEAPLYPVLRGKWYVDELVSYLLERIILPTFRGTWLLFDRFLSDGLLVGGVTRISQIAGWGLSGLQTGRVQFYVLFSCVGLVAVALLFFSIGYQLDFASFSYLKSLQNGQAIAP